MGNTPICQIGPDGITKPIFSECLAYFQGQYSTIYGADLFIAPEDRDTQFLSLLAAALDDVNAETVAAYDAYRPEFAQGVGLSTIVKINGIARKTPTKSSALVRIIGQFGTVITNGIAKDENGVKWLLPEVVTIPFEGQIDVTVTCEKLGAITATLGTINQPFTPVAGWQSIANIANAVVGAPVENDALLRQRQALSTSIPAKDIISGILGAILSIPGVSRAKPYENVSDLTDANGLPAHSIAFVVEGGDALEIATVINVKKPPGIGTFGTTTVTLTSNAGIPIAIAFSVVKSVPITVEIRLRALLGFTLDIQANIQASVAAWIVARPMGSQLLVPRLYSPAQLYEGAGSETFEITSIKIARDGLTPVAADIALAFDEDAYSQASYITIIVVI